MCEPELFKLRHLVKSRDLKVAAAMSLFLGGFAGRAILDRIGAAGALGVGVGFRVLIAISWLFVPPVSASKSK